MSGDTVSPAPAPPRRDAPAPELSPDRLRDLADFLKSAAREEGFDPVGITDAAPPAGMPAYRRWIAEGRHAGMRWLADQADVRADVRNLLPAARSVLCVGFPIWPDPVPPTTGAPHRLGDAPVSSAGAVAAFARGRDYHRRLKRKLVRLCRRLESWVGAAVPTRCCLDIAPVLERDLAMRAGLGWLGKNTMLLSPRRGSFLMLAEILIGLPLPADAPAEEHCGSCTACLDACPTGAFPEPWVLDAGRCISYVGIEKAGPLTDAESAMLGAHVFGCDICQDVCPFNRRTVPTTDPDFAMPRAEVRTVADLAGLLALDEAGFAARFAGNVLMRAGRQGVLRNAAAALGNVGPVEAAPAVLALRRAAGDADPVVADAARRALERLGAG